VETLRSRRARRPDGKRENGRQAIIRRIDKLNVWRRGAERAPHKPLLLLLALGVLSRGQETISFSACEQKLTELLREFGPSRGSHHPEYPFWRLQNDGLWQVTTTASLGSRRSNTDPTKRQLREGNAVGSFPEALRDELKTHPDLISDMARRLLNAHFPESLHQDILDAVGLSLETSVPARSPRDPTFRTRVLTAYEFRCAICGLDARMANATIGLEAAHIQWHQAGGPDIEANGVALCCLHHKLFDLGALTISNDGKVLISERATGGERFGEMVLRHHGQHIRKPVRPEQLPNEKYLGWHRREVFKERARPY
jgi:putative restriction endonuclease